MTKILPQGQIYSILTKRSYVDANDKDKTTLEFNTVLLANQYRNFNSMHIFLPIKKNLKQTKTTTYLQCNNCK